MGNYTPNSRNLGCIVLGIFVVNVAISLFQDHVKVQLLESRLDILEQTSRATKTTMAATTTTTTTVKGFEMVKETKVAKPFAANKESDRTSPSEEKDGVSTDATTFSQKKNDVEPDVVEISRRLPADFSDHGSGMKVAMCHKTLFGETIDLTKVMKYAAYYRFLGVDQVYIWYLPMHVNETVAGFSELNSLPYVKLIPNHDAALFWYAAKKYLHLRGSDGRRDGPGGQQALEMDCMRMASAQNFTWVLNNDADEYFWYKDPSIGSVKDFLEPYTQDYYYLSFSKKMHSLEFRSKQSVPATGFGLDGYGFTHKGFYCKENGSYGTERGSSYCPSWLGSSKTFVKPDIYRQKHKKLDTHGPLTKSQVERKPDAKIFDAKDARFFEFPYIFSPHNVTLMSQNETAMVQSGKQVGFSLFKSAYLLESDGSMEIHYESTPDEWFQFVLRRALDAVGRQ